jgi:hypothetical protein
MIANPLHRGIGSFVDYEEISLTPNGDETHPARNVPESGTPDTVELSGVVERSSGVTTADARPPVKLFLDSDDYVTISAVLSTDSTYSAVPPGANATPSDYQVFLGQESANA